ncbi:hypothetical protein GIB67_031918 [Kingdonia uniflora]|uniref:Protein CHROMATIN REMODELING 24 n=1 Tax=Kingdonia uniflora TaxID=39325 RepID=A0A7J7NTY7_9MAGN|nr:hypothetical protein GIB67_031918 [Kingdonia uniflora]
MAENTKPLSLNERHQRLLNSQSRSSAKPPPSEIKEPKLNKIEGRRRLCKIASKDDTPKKQFESEEPNFGIMDFDSPPESIRGILDDLSSRLEFMSIEKKKPVKVAEPSSLLIQEELLGKQQVGKVNDDVPDYSSATSSFSVSPYKPDLSPDVQGGGNGEIRENEVECANSFGGGVKDGKILDCGVNETFISLSDDDDYRVVVRGNDDVAKEVPASKYFDVDDEEVISVDDACEDYSTYDEPEVKDEGPITLIGSGKTPNYTLPAKIAKILYPHQRDGLRWLWSLHSRGTGGILGDDMGLGKTMQICSFLAGLFHSNLIKRVLVVAPKTLLAHWIKELSAVGLGEKTKDYFGTSVKARQYELQFVLQHTGILLTTYDIVRNNSKSLRGDSYFDDEESDIQWDYILLDEGHIIKNPSTQRAKSLLEIPSNHRIIISGTPIQNNLKELWALFSFCCPELLGDTKEFKARYEGAILRGNDKNASNREKHIGSRVAKELRKRIEPYFLRRLKSEVFLESDANKTAKLSKKNEMIVWLRLTQPQRQLYEAFLNSEQVLSSFNGSPLAALTVLKKICDHPFLLTKRAAEDILEGMDTMLNQDDLSMVEKMAVHLANATDGVDLQKMLDNVSCKISFIMALLEDLIPKGHNVLIFSQTRKMLDFVQEAIISKDYKYLRIDGNTKAQDREKIVKDFQEGGAPIFLLTSQVGGLGLTLTKADRVIVVDPAWNPSTDNQSVDRAYRIGQKKDVFVYRLMTCGTIEEKIYKMQVYKGGLFKTATEHKEQTRYFSQQDLKDIFALPKDGFDISLTQQQLHEEHDRQHIMDNTLKIHIEFLESLGIAGVSHHSLLFSKTATLPVEQENEEPRRNNYTYVGSSSSDSSAQLNAAGSENALNPKDMNQWRKNSPGVHTDKITMSQIKDKIERMCQTLANKEMISRLPDKGAKIHRQINELNLELEKIKLAESSEKEVIDLDDISGKFQRVLHV